MTSYWLILALLLGLAPAFIAYGKGRNFLFWWIYGVVLGPVALIHAVMLRDDAQPALEAASRRRGEPSGSPWPFLLRVACLFAIVIIAVAGFRILIPPNANSVPQRDVVSSDRTPPQMTAAAPETARDAVKPAFPSRESSEAEPSKPRASPSVRVTARQDRLPPEDSAKKDVPAEPARKDRRPPSAAGRPTATVSAPDKTAVPPPSAPPVPAAKPLQRIPPLESSTASKPPLSPVREVRKLAARTAPNEPTESAAAAQEESSANARRSARATKSAKAVSRPSTSTEKPAASGLPSLSNATAIGEMVLSVQWALKKRGYDPGPANGLAGQQTEWAIRKFQADRGLTPTGAIDYPLLQALDEERSANTHRSAPAAKSAKAVSRPSTSTEKPAASGLSSLSDVTAIGEVVLSVQRALRKHGYDPGPASGLAGQQTERAIRKFRADRGLTPTGGIDYPLLQALDIVEERTYEFRPPPGATQGR